MADGLGGLLGGSSVITQLFVWQVVAQILGVLDSPFLVAAASKVNAANPLVPLTPPDLAEMVIKSILQEAEAAAEAAKSGENSEHFHHRVLMTGEPPGLEQVLEWARRGFVPFDDQGPGVPSVPEAVRTSRIRSNWLPSILQAQFLPITAADAVNAWVRNQVDEGTALKYLYENGLKEPEARILFHTVGRAPGPMEALEMVRRGIIPLEGRGADATTFEQAVYEGDTKDKWAAPLSKLLDHIPGVFQIRQAQASGGITAQQAAHYYALLGVPADLAAGLIHSASGDKLAGSKHLAQGVIEALYTDKFIDHAQAVTFLVDLGYDQHEAEFVLDVVDYKLVAESEIAAITKVRAAFLARHIEAHAAREVLAALGVPEERQTQLLQLWDAERGATVRVLTPGEVASAVYYGVGTFEWGMGKLEGLGYSAGDAYVVLSVRLHHPGPNPPPDAPPAPPPTAATAPAA